MVRVTPSIFGFFLSGTGVLSIIMSRGMFIAFVHLVNKVADDFPVDNSMLFF